MTLEDLIVQLASAKQRLDELKAQSPEIAEALQVSEEYHNLMQELRERCRSVQQVVNPVQPYNPLWPPYTITTMADSTVTCANLKLVK